MSDWRPDSWQTKNALQQPSYPDMEDLGRTVQELSHLPPLVTSWEVESLKHQLAEASEGGRFLLQGGDCAEVFHECDSSIIANKLKILLQMSLVLLHGGGRRVVRVGRFGGQYAKPRSSDTETRDGVTLPSYRGDLINSIEFNPEKRAHNPHRLLRGYSRSALTLNFIRSLVDGGFADLHHPEYWDLDFVKHSPLAEDYQRTVEAISSALAFMETMVGSSVGEINRVDFFTSHEALHLLYEQAQTRQVPHRDGWYNLATHMPWVGMRTSQIDGAHIEYARGIANPIGVKVGPSVSPEAIVELSQVLNPDNEAGRLTFIHRFGTGQIEEHLPPLLEAIERAGRKVLWCCDPMHGNTVKTASGIKTRRFDDILGELEKAFDLHAEAKTWLGGVHFELTGDNVTECTGGARGLGDEQLHQSYKTFVDPRLNYEQALELAFRVAQRMGRMAAASRVAASAA